MKERVNSICLEVCGNKGMHFRKISCSLACLQFTKTTESVYDSRCNSPINPITLIIKVNFFIWRVNSLWGRKAHIISYISSLVYV